MDTQVLLTKLKKKFAVSSDQELADVTGISSQTINQWLKRETSLSETIVTNLIYKAVEQGKRTEVQQSIQPIVEFFPIECTESNRGARWKILPTDSDNPYYAQVISNLSESNGIYLFYNSTGHVIYAGKTLRQGLWKEMNDAFNRDRAAQSAFLVEHSMTGNFQPAYEKSRQLRQQSVCLYDIASYFSAYCVHDALVSNLEAFLIRALPNDLTNSKIENFNLS
jgi:DNA-binding transcriptional regulator YdaS (Cro superfamily)